MELAEHRVLIEADNTKRKGRFTCHIYFFFLGEPTISNSHQWPNVVGMGSNAVSSGTAVFSQHLPTHPSTRP